MGQVKGVNVVVGIPSFGMVSTYFMQARTSQAFPLVSSAVDKIVLNKPIAEARNEIVEYALQQGANYIFWLDDDVIAPPDSFLKLYRHHKDIINGVYWAKCNPPMPLLFRGHLDGPYWDWHVGDLIEIDAAGNGLTLVKTDVYRKISQDLGGPWYSTEYSSFKGDFHVPPNNTEDLYFYWKAKKVGYKVWADTSVQAYHYDKMNNVLYSMPPNSPQANPAWEIKPEGQLLIADLGCGNVSYYMRDEGQVVSFDIREDVKPDVVCDLRHIPTPSETFDIVFSSHTLEHFSWLAVDQVLKEWSRILKVGGELRIVVPNLRHVAKRLLEDTIIPTDLWVIFGEQDYPKNFHGAGFTPNLLKGLVESLGIYEDIQVKEGDFEGPPNAQNWSVQVKATKVKNFPVDNITPDYVEAPEPGQPNWIPVRLYEDIRERPMTEEEVAADIEKNTPPLDQKMVRAKKSEIIAKAKTYKKEKVDGLDSDHKE
jgi:predicted SAM-dependent methyltransferase